MSAPRILLLDPDNFSPEALAILRSSGEVDLGRLSRADLLERIAAYDVIFLRFSHRIDQELLEAASRLRIIATNATGIDHIDEAAAAAQGIEILSLRGEKEFLRTVSSTAELTWGLILALTRKIPAASAQVLKGNWERDLFIGRDLSEQRLGVVGLGRIGRKVANYGLAFDMEVSAYDPTPEDIPDGVNVVQSLSELLTTADIVTIHVPLRDDTIGLFGSEQFDCMKKGTLLVNTSRGQVLDENALAEALRSGFLGGAALDVLSDESSPEFWARSKILRLAATQQNIIVTPHIGGATYDSWRRTELFIADRVKNLLTSWNSPRSTRAIARC